MNTSREEVFVSSSSDACDLSNRQLTRYDLVEIIDLMEETESWNLSLNNIQSLPARIMPCCLVELDLSHNGLAQVKGLECLNKLRKLNLAYNKLTDIAQLMYCYSVHELNLRGNRLEKLTGIETMVHLTDLDVAENMLATNIALRPLSLLTSLYILHLAGNPITKVKKQLRLIIRQLVPHVERLDDKPFDTRDRYSDASTRDKQPARKYRGVKEIRFKDLSSCGCSRCSRPKVDSIGRDTTDEERETKENALSLSSLMEESVPLELPPSPIEKHKKKQSTSPSKAQSISRNSVAIATENPRKKHATTAAAPAQHSEALVNVLQSMLLHKRASLATLDQH